MLGEAVVLLATGKLAVRHRVIVADIMPDVLIGIDFLQSHGCTIDLDRNMLDAGGVDVPLEPTHNADPVVCRVHLPNLVTVPVYSRCTFQEPMLTLKLFMNTNTLVLYSTAICPGPHRSSQYASELAPPLACCNLTATI